MLRCSNLLSTTAVLSATFLLAAPLAAQDDDEYSGGYSGDLDADYDDYAEKQKEKEDEDADDDEDEDAEEKDEDEEDEDEDNTDSTDPSEIDSDADRDKDDSPYEKPGDPYYFLGLRYRGIIVPEFMMDLFGDGGTTVYVDGVGPEVSIRKDHFEYIFSVWWSDYSMDWTPFKAKDDPRRAYELVKSEINVLYLTADFFWSHPFSDVFALNWGMGAGVGVVWGDLSREQAYPPRDSDVRDPYDWERCDGVNDPPGIWCDDDNDHYDGYTEDSWIDGGSKPIVFPWFAIQTGFRVKPHKRVVFRGDLGFGISGPFFGVAAAYGF